MEICAGSDHRHLRAIARKLTEMAEAGDLQAIREVFARLDGRPVQAIERSDVLNPVGDEHFGSVRRREVRRGENKCQ
jgi:hypothetical protein